MENESVGGSVGFVGGTCHDNNDQSDSAADDGDVEEYTNDVGHHHHHHNHQHHHNELNCVDDGDIDVDERLQLYQPSLHEQQQQQQQQQKVQQKQKPQVQIQTKPKVGAGITFDHSQRQKRFTQQRSILKNSTERSSNQDEQELLEAKKQMILRRRRLFSHYRQYEQWRRRQFSYDPCYYRATPLPIGQQAAYNHNNNNTCNNSAAGGHGAFRRRRQYRRQYSCAEREDSRESRESSSLQRYKGESMIASDSFNVGSHNSFEQQQQRSQWLQQHPHIHQRQHQQQQHQHRHEQSVLQQQTIDCYSPTGTRRSHIHMLHEERSASISERCTRSRINSAIFVSSEGRGFDSIEFLRRHGSQSVLCRKAHSAENITNNGRKKSFSDNKRSWHTDEHTDSDLNATQSRQGDCDGSAIELRECRPNNATNYNNVCGTGESHTLSVLTAHTNCDHPSTSAAAAASMSITNVVVGSISLEAPPAHIKEELHNGGGSTTSIDVNSTNGAVIVHPPNSEKRQRPTNFAGISTKSSASRESADTVEELVLAPTVTVATAAVVPEIVAVTRSRSLVRQRSSTASISPHRSPKPITLKNPRTKIAALPMVSVSGPSPPQEKPLPQPTTGTEYL